MYFLRVISTEGEATLDLRFVSFIYYSYKFRLPINPLSFIFPTHKLKDGLYFRNFKGIKEKY